MNRTEKYLALLVAAAFVLQAILYFIYGEFDDHQLRGFIFRPILVELVGLLVVAALAGMLDYLVVTRLLKSKGNRFPSLFLENAIAIVAFFLSMPVIAELQILPWVWLLDVVLPICGFKAITVAVSMTMLCRGSPTYRLWSTSNAVSLALRAITIVFSTYVFIFLGLPILDIILPY
jgi:hypothetical protein